MTRLMWAPARAWLHLLELLVDDYWELEDLPVSKKP